MLRQRVEAIVDNVFHFQSEDMDKLIKKFKKNGSCNQQKIKALSERAKPMAVKVKNAVIEDLLDIVGSIREQLYNDMRKTLHDAADMLEPSQDGQRFIAHQQKGNAVAACEAYWLGCVQGSR